MKTSKVESSQGTVSFERADDATLVVRLAGPWHMRRDVPSAALARRELEVKPPIKLVTFDASGLAGWDTGLVSFLVQLEDHCHTCAIKFDHEALPDGLQKLLALAKAVPETEGVRTPPPKAGWLEHLGNATIGYGLSLREFLVFLGELTIAFGRFARGRARYRGIDLLQFIEDCGASAVGIVSLIAFLVGVILAFMGAVQLQKFGAAIYVADLVAIGMTREMGAMMTAIIMAGRTGAAYAAQIGTMKVTEELDALTTMGIAPAEFLFVPRVLALVLMMPLLCLFADFVGILGGAFVGVTILDLSPGTYFRETANAMHLGNVVGGLFKGTVYGALVALAGCLRGFQSGDSSSAVGDATTQAVVTAIVMVVAACGLFAFLFNLLGI
ncbi:MAG TPA: ABC transporter permease [Candidatus Binataceae bacterium]|nr:ABC transporter permease [Candidatus Binataceae bacterium]